MKFYTGIGSRKTPPDVLLFMQKVGEVLGNLGYTLRSGGADGADSYFEKGASKLKKPKMEIYIPWEGFSGLKSDKNHLRVTDDVIMDKAFDIASEIHPAWDRCSAGAQALHTRNIYQVLGGDIETPSKFVIYWAPESAAGNVSGGTRTAVEVARKYGIPTFNLLFDEHFERVSKLLEK